MPLPPCRHLPILFLQNALAYSCHHSVALPKNFIVSGSAGFSSDSRKPETPTRKTKFTQRCTIYFCFKMCWIMFRLFLPEPLRIATQKYKESDRGEKV